LHQTNATGSHLDATATVALHTNQPADLPALKQMTWLSGEQANMSNVIKIQYAATHFQLFKTTCNET